MTTKKKITTAVAAIVSIAFLILIFRSIDFAALVRSFKSIEWIWLLPFTLMTWLVFYWRAIRWKLLLLPSKELTVWQCFGPTMVGFGFNSILPARAGEFARPLALGKSCGVPYGTGLSTVVVERILDALMLVGLFALLPFFFEFQGDFQYEFKGIVITPDLLTRLARKTSYLVAVLFAGSVAMLSIRFQRFVLRIVNAMPLIPRGIRQKLNDLFLSAAEGFLALRNPRLLVLILIHTVGIWWLNAASFQVMSFGVPGAQLTVAQSFVFLVVTAMLVALPSVPGYWGLYEVGGWMALVLCGIVDNTPEGYSLALSLTLVVHFVQWILPTAIGLYYAGRIHVSVSETEAAAAKDVPPVTSP